MLNVVDVCSLIVAKVGAPIVFTTMAKNNAQRNKQMPKNVRLETSECQLSQQTLKQQ